MSNKTVIIKKEIPGNTTLKEMLNENFSKEVTTISTAETKNLKATNVDVSPNLNVATQPTNVTAQSTKLATKPINMTTQRHNVATQPTNGQSSHKTHKQVVIKEDKHHIKLKPTNNKAKPNGTRHMTLKSTNNNNALKVNNIHVTDNPTSDHVIKMNNAHVMKNGKKQQLCLKIDLKNKWKTVMCPILGSLMSFICLVFTVIGIVMESLPIAGSSIILATVICFSTAFRIIKMQNGKWKIMSV